MKSQQEKKMTKVKTQARIVGEHFIVETCNQIGYMGYHSPAPEDLYLLECNALSAGTKIMSFK